MMILAIVALAAAGYAWGLARIARARRPFPRFAPWVFLAGLATIVAALVGPLERFADASLSWHMMQHLALIVVAAPLLLLGMPVRLALAALPAHVAIRLAAVLKSAPMRVVEHPLFGLGLLTLVLYGAHFSPLYERALEDANAHAAEHALFLTTGLVYWTSILALPPTPHASSHALRILTLFLSLPITAFLGFAFYVTNRVLYAHYAPVPGALGDQMNAGAIMWLTAGTPVLAALLWCVADWGVRERRLGAAFDASEEGSC